MCEQCHSYIYDYILTPLAIKNLLRRYIDNYTLRKCSYEVSNCISRALKEYVNNKTLIDCYKLFKETYDATAEIIEPEVRKEATQERYDAWIWNKFKETNQEEFREVNYAIQICMDNMVVKKSKMNEQLLEQFFMHKLCFLLFALPDIHRDHTEKKGMDNGKSLGPVPQSKLDNIRRIAGLPVREDLYISMYRIDELYN